MEISYKFFGEFTNLPRMGFGGLLICCSRAHDNSFCTMVLSVAITSRIKYRMTRLTEQIKFSLDVSQALWRAFEILRCDWFVIF